MSISPELMRWLLLSCIIAMAVVAGFFLRTRRLSNVEYLGWGMLILLVPLLGPFLVILLCSGNKRI